MKEIISDALAMIIVFAIEGLVATLCYNAIAWEFNLPQFNYFVITGALWTINSIRCGIRIRKKGE